MRPLCRGAASVDSPAEYSPRGTLFLEIQRAIEREGLGEESGSSRELARNAAAVRFLRMIYTEWSSHATPRRGERSATRLRPELQQERAFTQLSEPERS